MAETSDEGTTDIQMVRIQSVGEEDEVENTTVQSTLTEMQMTRIREEDEVENTTIQSSLTETQMIRIQSVGEEDEVENTAVQNSEMQMTRIQSVGEEDEVENSSTVQSSLTEMQMIRIQSVGEEDEVENKPVKGEEGASIVNTSTENLLWPSKGPPKILNNGVGNNDAVDSANLKDPTKDIVLNVSSLEYLTGTDRVTLGWKNIDVSVPLPRAPFCRRLCGRETNEEPEVKQILSDVKGVVKGGSLVAVMGASGAGKTTLMNVLAHRNITSVQVTGTVTVNGHPIGLDINSISAYIQQEDLFIGTLTVREHLTFNAFLRMDKEIRKKDRLDRVEEVLHELGLAKCADTVIGTPEGTRGISGGEKKRLSFASEIINNPPLLFADEPTSGLDAFTAQSVVSSLQRLASKGHTIMCTIHQPSSEVYTMFNSILLMAEGRVAYLGRTDEAVEYFSRLGYNCPVNYNPADYFVRTLAVIPGKETESRERLEAICDHYDEKEREREREREIRAGGRKLVRQDTFTNDAYLEKRSPYKASWCKQFRVVLWRCLVSNSRDPLLTKVRLFQSLVIGLIAGLIYLNTGFTDEKITNVVGVLFFLISSASFSCLQAVVFTFPLELPIFLREHKNGMYRTDVYFLSKTIAELPIFILSPLFMVVFSYWMIGLRSEFTIFIVFYGIITLITNVAVSFGYVISTLSSSVQAATVLGPPLLLPLILFGGFFLKDTTVPVYFIWLKYLSWFKYGFEALLINQFKGTTIRCPPPSSNATQICISSGDLYITKLGFDEDNFLIDIYALVALSVGFRIVSYLVLLRKAYKEQ